MKKISTIVVSLVLVGCAQPKAPHTTIDPTVTPKEVSLGMLVDLQNELNKTKLDLRQTLDASKELAESRKQIEIDLKDAQSEITIKEAEARNGREIEAAKAKFVRGFATGLGGFGAVCLACGIAGFFFVGRNLAIAAAATGAVLIGFAIALPAAQAQLTQILVWSLGSAMVLLGVCLGGMALMKLWVFWQSNIQAKNCLVAAETEGTHAGRIALKAQAAVLTHVGSVNYDPGLATVPKELA